MTCDSQSKVSILSIFKRSINRFLYQLLLRAAPERGSLAFSRLSQLSDKDVWDLFFLFRIFFFLAGLFFPFFVFLLMA